MAEATANQMNRFLAARRDARRRGGVIEQMSGTQIDGDRQQRFQSAMAEVEKAIKHGDEIGRELAEARLDAVLEESRAAARQQAEAERSEPVGFDGGARARRVGFNPHGHPPETAASLFARAMSASRAERAERDEQVIRSNL